MLPDGIVLFAVQATKFIAFIGRGVLMTSKIEHSGHADNIYGRKARLPQVAPTRKVVRPTKRENFNAIYASQKNERQLASESYLELNAKLLFEFCPDVLEFSEQPSPLKLDVKVLFESCWGVTEVDEQPPLLQLKVSGRRSRHTPDLRVVWSDSTVWLVQVKPYELAKTPKWLATFEACAMAAALQGAHFVVITEHEINAIGVSKLHALQVEEHRRFIENLGDPSPEVVNPPDLPIHRRIIEVLTDALLDSPTARLCQRFPQVRPMISPSSAVRNVPSMQQLALEM
jgi:hypothetical protein